MATRNSTRLTDKFIRSLKAPAKGNVRHTDSEVPGLAVRVTAAGRKAFTLDYRLHGRNRRYTVASWPEYNATAARLKAIELRKQIGDGIDPLEEKHGSTVAQLGEEVMEHLEAKGRSKSTLTCYRALLDQTVVPVLGKMQIKDLTTRDIEKLHLSLKDTPYKANRMLSLLSVMFAKAVYWEQLKDNPVRAIEHFHEEPRNVTLDNNQIKALVKALDEYKYRKVASSLMLIMLTGCRKSEALSATWDQFDLEGGVWTKPSSHTKQKRLHRVPLNPMAVALLEGLPQENEFVFPGRRPGTPLVGVNKDWAIIRKQAGLPNLRIHDLRHVYASILANQKLPLSVIGALLGHTKPQTTARYAHLLDEPLRDATNGVGALIEGVRDD
jgi:integrase